MSWSGICWPRSLRPSDACARVRHQLAPLAVVDAEYEAVRARRPSISRTLDGMVAVNGQLDPVTGETVLAAGGELARRVGCDASITRILLDPHSQPLDVGRATRVVGAGLRRALLVRDRTCRHPGCTRPGQWCHAHHRTHCAHGGPTAVHNLILLCDHHHTRVHLSGQTLTLHPDGRVTLEPPEHPLDRRPHD